MTTKPKAKKFRIRRGSPLSSGATAARMTEPVDDETTASEPDSNTSENTATEAAGNVEAAVAMAVNASDPAAMDGDVSSAAEVNADQALSEIRKEGLTGRQLRMARRIAQRHNIAATSDYDAVRQLRMKGVDPFKRANMLELVVADGDAFDQSEGGQNVQLPQTIAGGAQLPSTEVYAEDRRAREIQKIQREIASRRRRKLTLLMSRLAFFVFLPTLLAGYYYYAVATPLYATKSEFVIQQAESASAGGLGGLFSGTQFATSQDSITVQSYLQSRDAMLRLDQDHGFKAHFSQDFIDPITRLDPDATNEAAFSVYSKNVKIAFDPTEGIIKMEVSAIEPAASQAFSNALIQYAEDIVDNLSQRLRKDQMAGARESFEDAENKMREAQFRVIELQEEYDLISTDVELSLLTQRIGSLEALMTQEQLSLAELLANPRPNPARVNPLQNRIATLETTIAELRSQLTQSNTNGVSLARAGSELAVAQADLETRNLMMQQALQQLETARIEANRQTRYLSKGVSPIAPDEPTYPRAFENTMLAFLIFAGIYLMASLTASILREQVSS